MASWMAKKTSARLCPGRCLPGGAAILPPKSPPGESVVIPLWLSNKNPEINRADVCLAGSIKDNTCQSHNEPKCSGPAQEPQRHRSATRRCPARASTSSWSCDRRVTQKAETLSHRPEGVFFDALAPAVRRGSCYLLHAHALLRCLP